LPQSFWDLTLIPLRKDRPKFIANGFNGLFRVGTSGFVSEKKIAFYERIFFQADPIAIKPCFQIYTTEDLLKVMENFGQTFNKPSLLIQGGNDGGILVKASAKLVQKLVPQARLLVYERGGHGELIASQ